MGRETRDRGGGPANGARAASERRGPAPPPKRRSVLSNLLRLLVAGGILAYLFTRIPLGDVLGAMGDAAPSLLFAAWAVTMAMQWSVAYRLRHLLAAQDMEWSIAEIFDINLATLFYGLFLPGGNFTGIAIRFYRLSGEESAYAGVGVGLLMDRIVATITLCVLGILFWLLERPAGSLPILLLMVAGLVGTVLLIAMMLTKRRGRLLSAPGRMVRRLAGARFASLPRALGRARELPRRALVEVFLLSFLAHLLGVVAYFALIASLGIDLSFVSIGWIRSVMILVTMIPISISGLGLREGAVLFLLRGYGVAGEAALAFSLLVFGVTVLGVGLVGGLFEARRLLR